MKSTKYLAWTIGLICGAELLVAIALGVAALCKLRPHWLWAALGFLALLLPGLFLIYVFMVTIATLYQQNPL